MNNRFFSPPEAMLPLLRGRYTYEENGRAVGLSSAFLPGTLVGVRLSLPRMLGSSNVTLSLRSGGDSYFLPLRPVTFDGADLSYATLLPPSLGKEGRSYTPAFLFSSSFGMLSARREPDGCLSFSRDLSGESGLPPLSFGGDVALSAADSLSAPFAAYWDTGEYAPLLHWMTAILPTLHRGALERALSQDAAPRISKETLPSAAQLFYGKAAILVTATLAGRPPAGTDGAEPLALYCRHLGEVMQKESLFARSRPTLLGLTEELFAFARQGEGEALITLCNRSPLSFSLSSGEEFSVLLGGRGRKARFSLSPYSALLLRLPLWRGEGARLHIEREPLLPKKRTPPPIRRPRVREASPVAPRETVIRTVIDF